MIYYAGIGARQTPEDVCRKMSQAGRAMASLGFTLRSGGAKGADAAFESAALEVPDALTEIYLPFKGFNRNDSQMYGSCREARKIASHYHPRWNILSDVGREFHARNVYQILGQDLVTPSDFVLCWTPGGRVVGGTGQALRIAHDHNIPILNFATDDDDYISNFILKLAERN